MKKDIIIPEVVGISLAIVRKFDALEQPVWHVYLLNKNAHPLFGVLIASRGYGEINGQKRETSVLRHMFETVPAESHVLIEPIDPQVFSLYNEYWVSYYIGTQIYDKRFIFVPESITEQNLIPIQRLNAVGILHD